MKTLDDLDNRDESSFYDWFLTEEVPPMTLDEAVDYWWTQVRSFDITHNGIFWRN